MGFLGASARPTGAASSEGSLVLCEPDSAVFSGNHSTVLRWLSFSNSDPGLVLDFEGLGAISSMSQRRRGVCAEQSLAYSAHPLLIL